MTVLDSLNSSPGQKGIPRQGSQTSMLSADEDIAALIAQITQASPEAALEASDDYYEPDDDNTEELEDLDALVAQLPASLSDTSDVSLTPDIEFPPLAKANDEDDLIDSDDDDICTDTNDTKTESADSTTDKFKKYLIAGLAIVVLIILAGTFVKSCSADNTTTTSKGSQAATTTATANTFYTDMLTYTDTQTYQDSMIVEKYIILDKDACLFVFEGYAENARAFVKTYVDIDTYNKYKTGARVPILYERISISGEDYYMKVRVNV